MIENRFYGKLTSETTVKPQPQWLDLCNHTHTHTRTHTHTPPPKHTRTHKRTHTHKHKEYQDLIKTGIYVLLNRIYRLKELHILSSLFPFCSTDDPYGPMVRENSMSRYKVSSSTTTLRIPKFVCTI